ncbi:MAG: RrF2 family transcriptional regulator [Candidatus Zixiibacteriota bacterium]
MVLSKSAIYGLRATLFVASLKRDGYTPVREISRELKISFHFLAKILQSLTQVGILRSFRGPNGGVTLARAADEIMLSELVEAIEGPRPARQCILGLPGCGIEKPCPLHHKWEDTQNRMDSFFRGTTLGELSHKIVELDLRLV